MIVSVVWQAMTLLRSQHPGLGPGESTECTLSGVTLNLYSWNVLMRRVGMVSRCANIWLTSEHCRLIIFLGHVFLGRSQIRPKPALLDQQVLGLSNMTSGETGAVSNTGFISHDVLNITCLHHLALSECSVVF